MHVSSNRQAPHQQKKRADPRHGSMCEMIGKYLDLHMKPMVELLPSYSHDTGDVIRKVDNIYMEGDMWLVSFDIEALYTSIKHEDGIEAAKAFFVMSSMPEEQINFLFALLEFTLRHNFFLFKESLYLQLQGTAMGASCVPGAVGEGHSTYGHAI